MKGLITGLLVVLYALPAFSAGGASRIIPGTDTTTSKETVARLTPVADSDRSTAARGITATRNTNDTVSSDVATRTAVSRTVKMPTSDASLATSSTRSVKTATRTVNRASAVTRSLESDDAARSSLESAVRTVGRSSRTEAASINANPIVRRAGLTLRPSTAEVGGRAILASGEQTGSNIESEIRNLQSRSAQTKSREEQKLDPVAIADAKERLEQTAALNKSCQEQYNDCMDQFCAVIDANQKRCSCSSNLAKYAKVEKAVKEANNKLNEVAQNIRYVGLSADEISAIMSATEAEEVMSGVTDTTESRSMLESIEKMIKDPTTTASAGSISSDSYGLLDLNLDFSSADGLDLFNLDFLTGNNGSSFSNLRGTDLYNAAKKRCNTIISQCKEVGATAQQITGNYDLAIDKDCIAYEQGLNKMNETLSANVRSATLMLQKARLAVLQNQNAYDARECISALEKCMTDDMVCGEDYTKCLDPTKMYIDENGSVVLGKNINTIKNFMSNYNNADINSTTLATAYSTQINGDCTDNGHCVVKYLLTKIGTQQKATDEGLCRPVLDKCRAYTYDSRGNYIRFNDIVVNYIQRAMVNIKAAQYKIISDYASMCLTDIASCYNDQVSQLTSWSATAAASSVYNIMRGACRNVALTCGYAVFSSDAQSCPITGNNAETTCIESISEIFYQSLLCPDNSVYVGNLNSSHDISANNTVEGFVNSMCQCKTGFTVFNSSCLPICEAGLYSSTGICTTATCPAGAREASDTDDPDKIFWDHCICNGSDDGAFWVPSKQRCMNACPNGSEPVTTQTGDILDGWCECKDNENFVPKPNGDSCQQCPDHSHVNNSGTGCVCEEEGYTYNLRCNQCVSSGQNMYSMLACNPYIISTNTTDNQL